MVVEVGLVAGRPCVAADEAAVDEKHMLAAGPTRTTEITPHERSCT
jgi:hypothetical protein